MSTFHDTVIKDAEGNIHFPRTDISSVRSVDGTKTLETIIEEEINAIGAVRSIDYGTCTTYSASATYALNALVIYNNRLYRCTTAITVAEAWNATHWGAIADAQNGTVYNTTDSSFYGIRGADSVAKKLGSAPKITEVRSYGGFQEAGGGWSMQHLYLTIDITGQSKCTITSHTGVTVTLDGVVTSFTAGVPFNILGKSTMIIKQERAQMGYVLWTNSASGIYIE